MTPAELRAYADVMREMGVFKVTFTHPVFNMADAHVTIELSQSAIAAALAERTPIASSPNGTSRHTDRAPAPTPDDEEQEDPYQFMATEGMPG